MNERIKEVIFRIRLEKYLLCSFCLDAKRTKPACGRQEIKTIARKLLRTTHFQAYMRCALHRTSVSSFIISWNACEREYNK
jgi:hypothetical protein